MAVYVDTLTAYGGSASFKWKKSCHMYADTLQELYDMADLISLRREWFQSHPRLPHYDLVASKRRLAVSRGAKEHTLREMVNFMNS